MPVSIEPTPYSFLVWFTFIFVFFYSYLVLLIYWFYWRSKEGGNGCKKLWAQAWEGVWGHIHTLSSN